MNYKIILTAFITAVPLSLSAHDNQEIIQAVYNDDIEAVERAFDAIGIIIKTTEKQGSDLLSIAAQNGSVAMVHILLQAGATPKITIANPQDPRWIKHKDVIERLLRQYTPGLNPTKNNNPVLVALAVQNKPLSTCTPEYILGMLKDYDLTSPASVNTVIVNKKTYILFLGLFLSSALAMHHDLSTIEQYLQTQFDDIVKHQKETEKQPATPSIDVYDTIAKIRACYTADEIEKVVLFQFTLLFPQSLAAMYVAMTEPGWFKMGLRHMESQ